MLPCRETGSAYPAAARLRHTTVVSIPQMASRVPARIVVAQCPRWACDQGCDDTRGDGLRRNCQGAGNHGPLYTVEMAAMGHGLPPPIPVGGSAMVRSTDL